MDVLYWIQNSDCLTKHIIDIPSLSKLEREVSGHVLSNGVSISDRLETLRHLAWEKPSYMSVSTHCQYTTGAIRSQGFLRCMSSWAREKGTGYGMTPIWSFACCQSNSHNSPFMVFFPLSKKWSLPPSTNSFTQGSSSVHGLLPTGSLPRLLLHSR